MWKLYKIQIPVPISSFIGAQPQLICLCIVCGWFRASVAELSSCKRDCVA